MTNEEIREREERVEARTSEPEENPGTRQSSGFTRRGVIMLLLVLAAVGALGYGIYSGITARASAEAKLTSDTDRASVTPVNVVYPRTGAPTQEIVLPGNTQAYTDTPIYARTSGYLRHWYFDIGAQVKQGQLLADIEAPEIDQQLLQARAEVETAKANFDLAKSTAARWQFLLKSDSVSKQETDEKLGDLSAKKAVVDSNESNVKRLEELQAFQKVYAPFNGVITARNTDIGALIDSGSNSAGRELFHLAATGRLRVFVAVPEVFSRAARRGAEATLTLDEFPGKTFHGTLVRTSGAIDQASRTLNTEVDVENPSGQLLPGSYVFVHLKMGAQIRSLTLPANTLLFRSEGLQVAVVRNNQAELQGVTIGRDYGNTVEIMSGLQASDRVIVNPADSLVHGTPVRINKQTGENGE